MLNVECFFRSVVKNGPQRRAPGGLICQYPTAGKKMFDVLRSAIN
jgi:hypothetical protein